MESQSERSQIGAPPATDSLPGHIKPILPLSAPLALSWSARKVAHLASGESEAAAARDEYDESDSDNSSPFLLLLLPPALLCNRPPSERQC